MSAVVVRSEHEKKFDRQIRLWGSHGQRALENCHAAVLGASATASEILKNLCLANLGAFTLIDEKKLEESDLGNNFFVEAEGLGKSRAQVVKEMLLEMNPDVRGHHLEQDPVQTINHTIEYFSSFQLVIVTQWHDLVSLRKLADFCYSHSIALFVAKSYGLLGYLRIVVPEHNIVETHPSDVDLTDLYLHPTSLATFPELEAFIDSFNLPELDSMAFSHVPYAVLLGQAMKQWHAQHGNAPTTNAERDAFRESIKAMARNYPAEQNFEEAVNFAFKAYTAQRIPSELKDVFNDEKCTNLNAQSSDFWILARAVKDFMAAEGRGCLPVSPEIPDMHADSQSYVQLKRIFYEKHMQHVAAIGQHVQRLLQEVCGRPTLSISPETIAHFVKNIRTVKSMRYRSLEQELSPETAEKSNIVEAFEPPFEEIDEEKAAMMPPMPKATTINWYFALRAVDLFYAQHSRLPSSPADAPVLQQIAAKILTDLEIESELVSECFEEICRWNGCEIHTIAAFMGGVVAQEVKKIIVQQFVPLNNTFIYNGITCAAESWEL
eukprot:TRINITY_DN4203_c0_g1_i1.p1 TRINITY_DN4203_c0_g1~~TRINITY_DN4203_c0_g1_i1.p1  ORF type:complete len:572 (-),score=221.32 TRINITY_DN4203_c0_g1_i1:42-1688(-)